MFKKIFKSFNLNKNQALVNRMQNNQTHYYIYIISNNWQFINLHDHFNVSFDCYEFKNKINEIKTKCLQTIQLPYFFQN